MQDEHVHPLKSTLLMPFQNCETESLSLMESFKLFQ